jgi:hypothetical protein
MKIIDQTPFFSKETGEISILDRGKAMMKFGASWIKEVKAQNQIIAVLGKVLDKNYTLLRNVTPAGLGAIFPFILIGPPGVFVMYVTPLSGMFRAKGDQWGTISGNNFINEKTNLLTRTERMAHAIQVLLQRQSYSAITSVDPILLCSDPSVHVDTIRPIIRVVMRDALERFAISLMQARVVLNPESVQDIIVHILNPPKPAQPQPAVTPSATGPEAPASFLAEDPNITAYALPESQTPAWSNEPGQLPLADMPARSKVPLLFGMTKKQWIILIVMFIIWCLLAAVLLVLVVTNDLSSILSLLP